VSQNEFSRCAEHSSRGGAAGKRVPGRETTRALYCGIDLNIADMRSWTSLVAPAQQKRAALAAALIVDLIA
jgi:hypothetical protein